jgi:hypothetical protein
MAQIYRILIRCPTTGKALDTGIRTSGRDAITSDIYRDGTVSCRHCGKFHPLKGNIFVEPDAARLRNDLWRPNP